MDTDSLDEVINEARARVARLASTVLGRPELAGAVVAGVEVNGWSGHVEIVFADPSDLVTMGMGAPVGTPAADLIEAVVLLDQALVAREDADRLGVRLAELGVQE